MADAYYLLTTKKLEKVSEILTGGRFRRAIARFTPQEEGFYFEKEFPYKKDVDCAPVAVANTRNTFNSGKESHLSMVYACLDANLSAPETRIYVNGKLLEDLLDKDDSEAIPILKTTNPHAVYNPSSGELDMDMLKRIQDYKPRKS